MPVSKERIFHRGWAANADTHLAKVIYFRRRRKIRELNFTDTMIKNRLTKTAYLNYLKCPQEFWLANKLPLLVVEPYSLEYEHLRQQGYTVQQLVKAMNRFQSREGLSFEFERHFKPLTCMPVAILSPPTKRPDRWISMKQNRLRQ